MNIPVVLIISITHCKFCASFELDPAHGEVRSNREEKQHDATAKDKLTLPTRLAFCLRIPH